MCSACNGTGKVQMDFGTLAEYPCYRCRPEWWKRNPHPWIRAMGHSQVEPGDKPRGHGEDGGVKDSTAHAKL